LRSRGLQKGATIGLKNTRNKKGITRSHPL